MSLAKARSLSLTLAPAVIALWPAQALACPTELGAGVVYTDADGTVTTVTPTDRPGVLTERVILREGSGYEIETLHGLFELAVNDIEPSGPVKESRVVSAYAALPDLPAPGAVVEGIMAQVSSRTETFARRHDVTAGELGDVVIGGCPYQGYPVAITVIEEGAPSLHRFVMVPSLGMTFYLSFEDQAGVETYDLVSVTALPAATPAQGTPPAPAASK